LQGILVFVLTKSILTVNPINSVRGREQENQRASYDFFKRKLERITNKAQDVFLGGQKRFERIEKFSCINFSPFRYVFRADEINLNYHIFLCSFSERKSNKDLCVSEEELETILFSLAAKLCH
jgi:hypothetical protein